MDISAIFAGLLALGVCQAVPFERKVENKTLVVITCPVLMSEDSPIKNYIPESKQNGR